MNLDTFKTAVYLLIDLTLTSVVFEFGPQLLLLLDELDLTLTSVVFEYKELKKKIMHDNNLTLTSVVFELEVQQNLNDIEKI